MGGAGRVASRHLSFARFVISSPRSQGENCGISRRGQAHANSRNSALSYCRFPHICYYGRNYSHLQPEGTSMTNAEKISIALPAEMVQIVRSAVAAGEYASSSEVIRDALRDWTYKRSLRQQGVAELRRVWQEALNDKTSGISPDDVLDRLERKYQAIADAASAKE